MSVTLKSLANLVGGTVTAGEDRLVVSARPIDSAGPDAISFAESEKALDHIRKSKAGAALVKPGMTCDGIGLIEVADPLSAFITVFRELNGTHPPPPTGISDRASVHPSAELGDGATVLPFAFIGEGARLGKGCFVGPGAVVGRFCRLGDEVVIHANAVLYDGTVTGSRVTIHAGAVIGADGFGYRQADGRHLKVPQLGYVEIGDDVEIGAGAAIDRGTFDATRIGEGTKIDNLVQIAHNCSIGRHNIFVSQAGIAGSSRTGDYVIVAAQAGIVDHVSIGSRALIGPQSGVTKDVGNGERVLGTPAVLFRDFTLNLWAVSRLAEWRKELKEVKRRLGMNGK